MDIKQGAGNSGTGEKWSPENAYKKCRMCGRKLTYDAILCPTCEYVYKDLSRDEINRFRKSMVRKDHFFAGICLAFGIVTVVLELLGLWMLSGMFGLAAIILSITCLVHSGKRDRKNIVFPIISIVLSVGCVVYFIIQAVAAIVYYSTQATPIERQIYFDWENKPVGK